MKEILVLFALIALAICDSFVGNWHLNENGNLYYIETKLEYNWFQALHECVRKNMSFVAVDSISKHFEIYNLTKALYSLSEEPRIWIGGHDNAINTRFEWIATGQEIAFSNWATGEPNKHDDVEHCVGIWSNALGWNDAPCSSKLGFICEENQSLKKTNRELVAVKEELDHLKSSLQAETFKEKMQELDDLKKTYEKQSQELQEKQNELESLENAYDSKINETLKATKEELDGLKVLTEIQATELTIKQEELNMLKETIEINEQSDNSEQTTEVMDSIDLTTFPSAEGQENRKEKMEALQNTNELLMQKLFSGKSAILNSLMKSNDNPMNRTITNRFYNFVVNVNEK